MPLFTVVKILTGNKISVSPGWKWQGKEGDIVIINGYQVKPGYDSLALHKITTLILNKQVELKNATNIAETNEGNAVACSVYLNQIDISQYFPELKNV